MSPFTLFVISLFICHYTVTGDLAQEKQALQSFISKVPHNSRYSWNTSDSVCNWRGVTCDSTNSSVVNLRLPGAGLIGEIPVNTIGSLTNLRVLSLRSNALTGGIPSDLSNLDSLRSVYLQNNKFSGGFPPSLFNVSSVERLDLSGNNFTGPIPFDINNLKKLTQLNLQNNSFSGQLPSINLASLSNLNLANNELNGSIPNSLSKFPVSAFSGNINLCGNPLPPCNSTFFPSPAPSPSSVSPPTVGKGSDKLPTGAIVAIAVGSALILALLLLILLLCIRKKRNQQRKQPPKPPVQATAAGTRGITEAGTSSSKDDVTGASTEGERNKLIFFEGGIYSFDLEDLLRASAEVLGKGSVGTSYKAVLEEGTTVVVKRLKDVVVTKKEFETQMEILGKMKNENVVPLRAFYYSKDEKLLVSDYMPAGSLSALLHGNFFIFIVHIARVCYVAGYNCYCIVYNLKTF